MINNQILISIIIPIYNQELFLDQCITSVITQTYKNIEIICIDDCSTDNSLSIIEKYKKKDSRIKLYKNSTNNLAGYCRNIGIKYSHGDYILFIDSDDFCETDLVEKTVKQLVSTNADICLFKLDRYLDADGSITKLQHTLCLDNINSINSCFSRKTCNIFNVTTPSPIKLFRRQFIINNKIKFAEGFRNSEDSLFVVHALLLADSITYVNEFLYHYRFVQNRETTDNSRNKYPLDSIEIYKQLIKKTKKYITTKEDEQKYIDFIFDQLAYAKSLLSAEMQDVFSYVFNQEFVKYCLKAFKFLTLAEINKNFNFTSLVDKNLYITNNTKKIKIFLDKKQCLRWPELLSSIGYYQSQMKFFNDIMFDQYMFVDDVEKCDIYVTECTNLNIRDDKLNMIICGESDSYYDYTDIMEKYKTSDNVKFIGTVSDTKISYNIPLLNWNQYNNNPYSITITPNLPSFEYRYNRTNRICFMRRILNDNKKENAIREKLAKSYNLIYINGPDKMSIISEYLINFCSENSLSYFGGNGGYITEKIYAAAAAKCIPLYYGGDIEQYSFLNPKRVLKINDNNTGIMQNDYQTLLSMKKNEYEEIFNLPLLRSDYNEFVNNRIEKLKKFIQV